MSMNELSHLTPSPILIYTALGVYGVLLLLVVAYVHAKFRAANQMLKALKHDWDSAETKHAGFIDQAQEQMTRLVTPAPVSRTPVTSDPVNGDLRNQVTTMSKKGIPTNDIARSCGLPEGEVDVLLGLARIQVSSR